MSTPYEEPLPEGLYEALLTRALAARLEALPALGKASRTGALDPVDSHELFAQHLYQAVRDHLRTLPQNRTSASSKTGQRYIHHVKEGSNVLLLARDRDQEGLRELLRPLPADLYIEAKLAAG